MMGWPLHSSRPVAIGLVFGLVVFLVRFFTLTDNDGWRTTTGPDGGVIWQYVSSDELTDTEYEDLRNRMFAVTP